MSRRKLSDMKIRLARALRASAPYRGFVDRASACLKIIFEPGEIDDCVALMAQALADYGLELGPETDPEDAPPFDAIDSDRIAGIDIRLRQRVIDFVRTPAFAASELTVEEVARRTVAFFADLTVEERTVAFARMLKDGLAPYAQIPAGLIEPNSRALAQQIVAALHTERVQHSAALLERIGRRPETTIAQVIAAMAKVIGRHFEQPDEFMALFGIAVKMVAEAQAVSPAPSIMALELGVGGDLAAILGAALSSEGSSDAVLEQHVRTCEGPDCPFRAEYARRRAAAGGEPQ